LVFIRCLANQHQSLTRRLPVLRSIIAKGGLATALLALACGLTCRLHAGGSGLNTVVVVNQNSPDSCELGNYYCERRQVPPGNLLRINWPGGNISWSSDDFQTILLVPLLQMLASRQLAGQVDYVVLSMDIPFQTVYGSNKVNSTTSALFYGLKDDSGPNWMDVTNSYSGSEQIFHRAPPASAPGYSFLATMLTAGSLAQAKALVDQGVASDGTFPRQPMVLAKTSDPSRNIRYHLFDNAIFNTRLLGKGLLVRTNSDSPLGQTKLMGYETGSASFSIAPNSFVPGAMADSLTSFGGIIFGPNSQTTLLAFIGAGAAGSYGTVTEPWSGSQKFPDPQDYFYQARGFSIAECYYQSLYAPYEGLVVAEPLAAPFAQTAAGTWTNPSANAVLSGTAQLGLSFSASDANHPLQQIDLFVDGVYYQTLTNCAPRPGNVLAVTLNGYPLSYTVPSGATVTSVAGALAGLLNAPAISDITGASAQAHGDRIELRLAGDTSAAGPVSLVSGPTTNLAGASPLLSAQGRTSDGSFGLHVQAPAGSASLLQASTDLVTWTTIGTIAAGGAVDYVDAAARDWPRRFYRVVGAVLEAIQGQVAVSSYQGSANALTTFLTASRNGFLSSEARGLRAFNLSGTMAPGAWAQLNVSKTNGVIVSIGVTNRSATATLFDLAQQLTTAVNSCPALQGPDGLAAEDLAPGIAGNAEFNLQALSPGRDAAAIQASLATSATLSGSPSTRTCLDANLCDLQPRDHLYVSAGAAQLALTFPLDTTLLADGYHELQAVAYEGTDVRTQTRVTVPVQVRNTALSASLTLLDLPPTTSVSGTYHIQVAASAPSAISLYSTGGLLGTATGQATATFSVNGSALGAGLHPFYAVIQHPSGAQFRTAPALVRLTSP
jgi:uncharacterized protein (TIGR03790 family)